MFPARQFSGSAATPAAGNTPERYGHGVPPTPLTVLPIHSHPTSKLDQKLSDEIESFLTKIKRKRFVPKKDESMSMLAAHQATEILQNIVDFYGRSTAKRMEQAVVEAESERTHRLGFHKRQFRQQLYDQTQEVIQQVTAAGRQLQRSSAFRILLANATRRVLAILREAVANSTMTEAEFETYYSDLLFIAKRNRKASKSPSQSGLGRGTEDGDFNMEDTYSEGEEDDSDGDSSDQDDAEEWGFGVGGGGTLPVSPFPGSGSPTQRPATPDNSGVVVGTPPTDGQLLPRVSSTAAVELQRARSKLQKPINFSKFYELSSNGITELIDEEYRSMNDMLISHAPLHVYGGELVVVYGCSHTIMSFLTAAAEAKSFLVLILEGAPGKGAAELASALASRGISCRIAPDSSCFAVMSRASKVFISAEAILANGGLLAAIGTHMVAQAAQHHAVPVVVVTVSLKLCPYYPVDRHCTGLVKISPHEAKEMPWSTFGQPSDVLPVDTWLRSGDEHRNSMELHNPLTEYVPPKLLALFVTDIGEFPPEDINRVVRDHYNPEDTHL